MYFIRFIMFYFSEQATVSQLVKTYGLQVSTIMLPTGDHLEYYDHLSQVSGGRSYVVRRSPHPMDTYVNILESLMMSLQLDTTRLV